MIGMSEIQYREKITVTTVNKKYVYESSSEQCKNKREECSSPTSKFWYDLVREFFHPTEGGIHPITGMIAYDVFAQPGAGTTSVNISTSASSTKLTLTASARMTWESPVRLASIRLVMGHDEYLNPMAYFYYMFPSPIDVPQGSIFDVTYNVEIFVSRTSNSERIAGWDIWMLPFFQHIAERLKGTRNYKLYFARAVLRNAPGTQSIIIPLELDPRLGRAYKLNHVADSRVEAVYRIELQGTSGAGGFTTLVHYTAPSLDRTFDIVQGQVISIEFKLNTP